MAVRVMNQHGATDFAEGVSFEIENGHLHVVAAGRRIVGAYAPGQWESVRVLVEEKQA